MTYAVKLLFVVVSLLVNPISTIAQSSEYDYGCPYLIDSESRSILTLTKLQAKIDIAGTIAEVKLTQVFINPYELPIEAIYVFPASTSAAINGLTMKIKERRIYAKIAKKEDARLAYTEAKASGTRASLLEQLDPNVFQMNVANIMPNDTIEVVVHYTEFIENKNGTYQFALPTTIGEKFSERTKTDNNKTSHASHLTSSIPNYTFDLELNILAPVPIQTVNSPTHKVDMEVISLNHYSIALNPTEEYGANRDFILEYGLRGSGLSSGILIHEDSTENYFALQIQPPSSINENDIPQREYIFVVDVSGSMSGFPIETTKKLMTELLSGLRPNDLFNLVLFEFSNRKLFKTSVSATQENIEKATKVLKEKSGFGGTNLLSTLSEVYDDLLPSDVARSIVVITDGFIDVEMSVFQLIRENLHLSNVFAFGIGESVNRFLIEGIAKAGLGTEFVVTDKAFAKQKAEELIAFINKPALTNINIDFGLMDVYDVTPRNLPDVLSDRPVVVYGKYRGPLSEDIRITGTKGGGQYVQNINATGASSNPSLKYLWARNTIREVSDFNDASEKTQAEITALGLKYYLVTNFTSFIAIDTEKAMQQPRQLLSVNQPLPTPRDYGLNNPNLSYTSRLNATGAVSRAVGIHDIDLNLPIRANSFAPLILLTWSCDKQADFIITLKNIFDQEVFTATTTNNYYWLQKNQLDNVEKGFMALKIKSKDLPSEEVGIMLSADYPKYHYLFDLNTKYALADYVSAINNLIEADYLIDAYTLVEIGLLFYPDEEELIQLRSGLRF